MAKHVMKVTLMGVKAVMLIELQFLVDTLEVEDLQHLKIDENQFEVITKE